MMANHIRPSRDEHAAWCAALVAIVEEIQPATVRQVFYQATVRGLIEKTELGYDKVQRVLVTLRRSGEVPWQWIADNTRSPRQPLTFGNTSDAVQWLAEIYRKSLWADADCQVQVWLEKDALSGVLGAVTDRFDVPLMVSRGYSSVTFLHEAAETLTADGRPAFVYHLGDHDPSGVDAARAIEQELRDTCVGLDIDFVRLAVLPEQIETMGLPSRPTKASDSRARGFGAESVELDAIDPRDLRQMLEDALANHLPRGRFEALKTIELKERATLLRWAKRAR